MAGALAEGLVKQDADEADHAAGDAVAAAVDGAAAAGADGDAPKPDEAGEEAPAAAAAAAAAADDGQQERVPVYVSLPMPQAEAAALGPRALARCHALSNAEAALLLRGFSQQERAANPAFEPSAAQQRAARYAERMGGSRNAEAVVRMQE